MGFKVFDTQGFISGLQRSTENTHLEAFMSDQAKRLVSEAVLCLQLVGGFFNVANGAYSLGEHISNNPHLVREVIQLVFKRQ